MPKKIFHYNIVTIGSAVQDIMFYTDQAEIVRNPKSDPTKQKLIGFEYGAKIHSDNLHYLFGGGAANTAITCAKLGLNVAAILRVGADSVGTAVHQHLQQFGVVTKHIEVDTKHHTGLSFLVVDQVSDEHVAFVQYGANDFLDITHATLKLLNTDWFYISSISAKYWPILIQRIIHTTSNIAWNPGAVQLQQPKLVKTILPKITVLLLNKDEAIELSLGTGLSSNTLTMKQLVKHIFALGPKFVVITAGLAGAYVYDGKNLYFDQPGKRKPVDTTGAGDAFGATFITSLVKRPGDIKFALRLATLNASAQVTEVGAQTGLLTWKQIMQRI